MPTETEDWSAVSQRYRGLSNPVHSIVPERELRNSVLVLSFIPMIHRTFREVRAWFREIEPEDIAQQVLALFLDLVGSVSPMPMNNYLPIALTRTLRKNSFRWAEKEKRHTIQRETDKSQEFAEVGAMTHSRPSPS